MHLGIGEWSILGHSFGGMLASYYASIHPEHVRLLILSSSGGINLGLQSYVGHSLNDKLSKLEIDSLKYLNDRIDRGDTSYLPGIEGVWQWLRLMCTIKIIFLLLLNG